MGIRMDNQWLPKFYQVTNLVQEMDDTLSFDLPIDIGEPGQFHMLYIPAVGEIPVSISRKNAGMVTHTVRGVGAVSNAICSLKEGSEVGVRGPFGSSWPMPTKGNALLVAGGLGLAPLRPLIEACLDMPDVQVTVLYGTRAPENILYPEDLKRWKQRAYKCHVTVDRGSREWSGNVGPVPGLLERIHVDASDSQAYICGPEIMMRFTVEALLGLGMSASDLYLSMERNMKCALGVCGHCQWGSDFVCKQGPVYSFDKVASRFYVREL